MVANIYLGLLSKRNSNSNVMFWGNRYSKTGYIFFPVCVCLISDNGSYVPAGE